MDSKLIYTNAKNMTDVEFKERFSTLSEKEIIDFGCLVRCGDSEKLALCTILYLRGDSEKDL